MLVLDALLLMLGDRVNKFNISNAGINNIASLMWECILNQLLRHFQLIAYFIEVKSVDIYFHIQEQFIPAAHPSWEVSWLFELH